MSNTARAVHGPAVARCQRRLSMAQEAPWLHREIGQRMSERLALMTMQPATVLDWWAANGGGQAELARAYPKAQVVAVETEAVLAVQKAPSWWQRLRAPQRVAEPVVAERSAQLVWANMLLHHSADPGALMQQWQRALAVDGFLMLSTLGPDTLAALRGVYADALWGPAHAPFVDMHDIGDMLVHSGFASPVMDQERLTLTWATPEAALAELRTLGQNTDPARHAGLRTPRWRERLCTALRERASTNDGRIALVFEVIYGHAFKPPLRLKVGGQTEVSLDEMRSMVQRRPASGTP
jgi:malonyl-CoA O-methyltransferase